MEGWRPPFPALTNLVSIRCTWGENELTLQGRGVCSELRPTSPRYCPSLLPSWLNQTHRPPWSIISCYLVTSCHDLPGPLVFPWRRCPFCRLLAASWLLCPDGLKPPRVSDPQLPASWSHTAVSVCSRRAAAPHHAKLVIQLLAAPCGGWLRGQRGSWYNRH